MLGRLLGIGRSQQARQVRIGSLWFDPTNVEHVLHRHCKQLFVLTGHEEFPYQFVGSSTAVNVAGRYLIFCCGHQIDSIEPENIAIYSKARNSTITASSLLRPQPMADASDTDWIDARALEYRVENYHIADLSREFFRVDRDTCWPSDGLNHFLIFGYPSERQCVDYEKPRIEAHIVEVGGFYDGASSSPRIHRLRMDRVVKFDADGMSGGSIFYIGRAEGSFFIGFAGMIVRGGTQSDIIHFIDAEFLTQMAEKS